MPNTKPFIQVACVCENVLIEPDNVASLIRIVDTYTAHVPKEPLPPNINVGVELTAFISLKSGDVVGEHTVGLRLNDPEGKLGSIRNWKVVFNGNEHGANLKIAFTLGNPKFGLYWFDVLWGDEVLTRIPFRFLAKTTESTSDEVAPSVTATQ